MTIGDSIKYVFDNTPSIFWLLLILAISIRIRIRIQ